MSNEQFASLIEPIARMLLGEPNRLLSSKNELRYGSRGSLSVDLKKGTWFDHEACLGGGALDLITRETGLHEQDRVRWMFDHGFELDHDGKMPNGGNSSQRKPSTIINRYPYVDDGGNVLFEVVRFEPKDFRQRRPDATQPDGWSWSVRGVRCVPYRLPELSEAIAKGQMVCVVEGEKDADNLWRIGIPATTNAGGAGKWRDDLNDYFRDADIVVIEDNDPQKKHPKTGEPMFHDDGRPIMPGQDHAHSVAEALSDVALRVRLLKLKSHWPEMPSKGDVSDWLAAGHTREQLDALVAELPTWAPGQDAEPELLQLINIMAWHGVEPRARRWAVVNRIPMANVTLLTGQGGVGKTLLMQQLSVATVLGRDWIGEMPEFGPVLFITAEDDEDELHFRYANIAKYYDTSFKELTDNGLHLLSLAGKDAIMAIADNRGIVKPTALYEKMVRTAHEIRPRWIGLDTAADIFVVNERDRSEVRQCISLLRKLALDVDTAVVLLAHPSLTGISSGTGLSGSTAWNNSVRSRLYLKTEKKKDDDEAETTEEEPDDGTVRILETMKSNYAGIGAPIRLFWRNGLLLPEYTTASPLDHAAIEEKARTIFLVLLERFNRQGLSVARKERANNFAPTEFARQPEAEILHKNLNQRKKMLRNAMEYLLAKERIHVGWGPAGIPRSRQRECLFKGGTLL